MIEWFSAHPVLTVFLVLLLTIRLWIAPVVIIIGIVGVAAWGLLLVILYGLACVWEWVEGWIKKLRRRFH